MQNLLVGLWLSASRWSKANYSDIPQAVRNAQCNISIRTSQKKQCSYRNHG